MEVRLLELDGIPRKEVRSTEFVTAFIEIGTNGLSFRRSDVMQKESGVGNHQCHFPTALAHSLLKVFAPQRRPALHLIQHLLRSMTTILATGTGTHKQSAHAVAFYIIVHSVIG